MAAGLVVPISGPYTGTWNALPLGTQYDDGYELSCTLQGQEVNATDAYGMTLVEAIYRGQNWRVRLRGLEWNKTGLLSSLQMFGQSGANTTLTPTLANVGARWTAFCLPLVLTAVLANPPTMPQSLTATNAGIAPNSQSAMMFTSKLRELPMEMVLLPYSTVIGSITYSVPFTST
jgi:hypothetical protein